MTPQVLHELQQEKPTPIIIQLNPQGLIVSQTDLVQELMINLAEALQGLRFLTIQEVAAANLQEVITEVIVDLQEVVLAQVDHLLQEAAVVAAVKVLLPLPDQEVPEGKDRFGIGFLYKIN